jgi:hypothetical protein
MGDRDMTEHTEIKKGDTVKDATGKRWIVQAVKNDGTLDVSNKGNHAVLITKTVQREQTNAQ